MKKNLALTAAACLWLASRPCRAEEKAAPQASEAALPRDNPRSAAASAAVQASTSPAAAQAAPQKPVSAKLESLEKWFTHWKQALQKSAVEGRYSKMRGTASAAVRGNPQNPDDPTLPYWKGSWSAKKQAERDAQRKELAAAVELVFAGKLDEASAALDSFQKAHPTTLLLRDVQEARQKLAELKAEQSPVPEVKLEASAKPEVKPETEKPAQLSAAPAETKPAEPAKTAEPAKAAEPNKPAETLKAAETAKP